MLRVSLLSAILAVSTAGSAPRAMIDKFLVPTPVAKPNPATVDMELSEHSGTNGTATAQLTASPSTVVHQARDGLFYVEASVNGEPVHFVVDTGASVVVLNASDAARAGVGASSSSINVETAAGSSSMQRTRIENISVAGQSMTGVAAVIMRKNLKVSLLGQSALGQLDSVALKGRTLKLN